MNKTLIALFVAAAFSSQAWAAGIEDTMTKAGCFACHQKDKKLVGPAFKDVAAKYKGQDVVAKLAAKARAGGSGVWGPVPMPPNTPDKINDADLKSAVEFILKQ